MKITKEYLKKVIKEELSRINEEYSEDQIDARYKNKANRFKWMDDVADVIDRVSQINQSTKDKTAKQDIDNAVKKFYKEKNKFAADDILRTINWYKKSRPEYGIGEQFKDLVDDLYDVVYSSEGETPMYYGDVPPELRGQKYKVDAPPAKIRKGKFD